MKGFKIEQMEQVAKKRWKKNLDIKNAINKNADIVLGNSGLVRDRNGFFFEGMNVRNLIHEWD